MDDATFVKVCDSAKDGPDEICGIPIMEEVKVKDTSRNTRCDALFIVVALCADAIEELATCAKIEAKVEIMGGLVADEQVRIARGYREKTSRVPRSNRAA